MRAMDKTMIIAVGNERLWAKFCKILGAEEMLTDPRFATNAARVEHRHELSAILGEIFAGKPLRWWELQLARHGVPQVVDDAGQGAEALGHQLVNQGRVENGLACQLAGFSFGCGERLDQKRRIRTPVYELSPFFIKSAFSISRSRRSPERWGFRRFLDFALDRFPFTMIALTAAVWLLMWY